MKKRIAWIVGIASVVFAIDWGVMGLKLMNGDYAMAAEAYIGGACLAVILVCAVCRIFGSKCPGCRKAILTSGKYCPHCGRRLD